MSLAALGVIGYCAWPRLGDYREQVERQRRLLGAHPPLHVIRFGRAPAMPMSLRRPVSQVLA